MFASKKIITAWRRFFSGAGETLSEDYIGKNAPPKLRVGLYITLLALLLLLLLGWYWSQEPVEFNIQVKSNTEIVIGETTTSALIKVVDVLLDKPGGYLSNDIMPPGIWMDNQPSWEYGVMIQVRDLSKAMRESFSRSQSQSAEDSDLSMAEPRFNVDHVRWAAPWPEREYREGRNYVASYLERLSDEEAFNAQFYASAEN